MSDLFIGCYPFMNIDPFIMNKAPHIYFVGNQDKFATELVTGKYIAVRH